MRDVKNRRRLKQWTVILLAIVLTACTQGLTSNSQSPDPVLVDFPVAYIKRPVPVNNQGQATQHDARRMLTVNRGAGVFMRDRAAMGAAERDITADLLQGAGDVKDLEVSYDGKKLLFSLRRPDLPNVNAANQPKWEIWEYNRVTDVLQRVIQSDVTAAEGHDFSPHYLPDGRIVFTSTRQRQSQGILLDEGKTQFAAIDEDRREEASVLHVMSADGTDIQQISFNQSHDFDPMVLNDGRILFSRWDNMGTNNAVHFYTVRPDGLDLQTAYGVHSHAGGTNGSTIQYYQPRVMENGRLLTVVKPFTGTYQGGDLRLVDVAQYTDKTQPIWSLRHILTDAGEVAATSHNVITNGAPSPSGRFASAYPLADGTGRLLVTWSPCRLLEQGITVPCTPERLAAATVQEAQPLYGVWIYDVTNQTQLPVVMPAEGTIITEAVAMRPRDPPPVIYDKVSGIDLSSDLVSEQVGVLHIRSVYDVDGADTSMSGIAALADPARATAEQRPARFLRIVKAVSMPPTTVKQVPDTAFGASAQQLMREIVGYAPIEPDGSVMVKVPANTALTLEVLDKNARRLTARHQGWIQVRPGEIVECNGCHTAGRSTPHGRVSAAPPPINTGAPTTGLPFINTDASIWGEMGETMAQARMRISCLTGCAALKPSMDVVFEDVWTDPVVRAKDPSFAYRYSQLTTAAPTSSACATAWANTCRTIIHYETHIHPLWGKARSVPDNTGTPRDRSCTSCHTSTDNTGASQLPAAQLDLTNGASSDQPAHFKAYRELLFADNQQQLSGGVLQDVQIQATDSNGNPLFETDENGQVVVDNNGQRIPLLVNISVAPSMTANGAAASSRFFDKFSTGATHAGWLDPAELRLLAEWLDIGAQYYNNPFAVP